MKNGKTTDRGLLNRLIISQDDLLQAKRFVRYVLEKKLHENEDNNEIKLILKAFNTAAIVSYCRPFTHNKSSETNPASPFLPKQYLDLLTDDEKKFHQRIQSIRNTEQAHSDADSHSVYLSSDGTISIKRDTSIPLEQAEFCRLEQIIDKFLFKIMSEKGSLV